MLKILGLIKNKIQFKVDFVKYIVHVVTWGKTMGTKLEL